MRRNGDYYSDDNLKNLSNEIGNTSHANRPISIFTSGWCGGSLKKPLCCVVFSINSSEY